MSPKFVDKTAVEFQRILQLKTMAEMAQELDKHNLSTQGSIHDLQQRLLRYHLNKHFPKIECLKPGMTMTTDDQPDFAMVAAQHAECIDTVMIVNGNDVVEVRLNGLFLKTDDLKSNGKMKCKTCDSQSVKDTSTPKKSTEKNDKDLMDYRLSCLNLLRSWILFNPFVKDESAEDFLGNLKDFRKFAKINDEALLDILPSVMWPSIKSWYRKNNFINWQQFERSFFEEYDSKTTERKKSSDSASQTAASFVIENPNKNDNNENHFIISDESKLMLTPVEIYTIDGEYFVHADHSTSSDSATQTTTSQPSKANIHDDIVEKLSAVTVSGSTQQENKQKQNKQASKSHKTDEHTHLECLKKLKFLGLSYAGAKGEIAATFIQDLNEFRKISGINDVVLMEVLPFIMDNNTKAWYRANKFTSWQNFETSFIANTQYYINSNSNSSGIQSNNIKSAPTISLPMHPIGKGIDPNAIYNGKANTNPLNVLNLISNQPNYANGLNGLNGLLSSNSADQRYSNYSNISQGGLKGTSTSTINSKSTYPITQPSNTFSTDNSIAAYLTNKTMLKDSMASPYLPFISGVNTTISNQTPISSTYQPIYSNPLMYSWLPKTNTHIDNSKKN